jgi:hypothetical protein
MTSEVQGALVLVGVSVVTSLIVHWRVTAFARATVVSGVIAGVIVALPINGLTLLEMGYFDPLFLATGPFFSTMYAIGISLSVGAPFYLHRRLGR